MSLFDVIDAAFPSLGQRLRPASPAPVPPRPALPPASVSHAHPQADREIRLGDCRVAYRLRRARRKSIGFVVSADGLTVSAPRWVGQGDIDQALQAKSGWILRKLTEQRERHQHLEAARIDWRDGAQLPFLGATLALRLDTAVVGAHLQHDPAEGALRCLRVGLAHGAAPTQIRDVVQSWLQQEALRHFEGRCAHFAERLGVSVRRLRLSAAQTRWGSASADGSIRLNWRLIHFSPAVIDYVVAHELAHLREMNHSPAFWEVVRSVIPDLDARRAALKSPVLPLFD